MKKLLLLLFILTSSNLLLLSSESDRLLYTKDTCNRTYDGWLLSTDGERKKHRIECELSRIEVQDKLSEGYVGSISFDPYECSIKYLSVDPEYKKQGIGSSLALRAIEDMRVNHNCRAIFLWSVRDAEGFWEKLGANPIPRGKFTHAFPDPSSNAS